VSDIVLSTSLKKGDKVVLLSGSEKGKTGEVLLLDRKRAVAYVKGLNLRKRHLKPTAQNRSGSIQYKESPLFLSKISLFCESCRRACRFGVQIVDAKKLRVCRRCTKSFD